MIIKEFAKFKDTFTDGTVIKFNKEIQIPDDYDEKTYIIPNSEYRITNNKRKGYEGWVILTGLWKTKTSTFGSALSFSEEEFSKLKKFIS